MIRIEKPYIISKNDKTRCICDIFIDNKKHSIFFEVDKKYGKIVSRKKITKTNG